MKQSPGAEDAQAIMFTHPYMAYWYAGTYVLIEGWRRLKLKEPEIDELLKSRNVAYLEQFRHAAFHYHPEYFDKKLLAFISSTDSVPWITQVREAFSQWFLKFLRQHGQEAQK